METINAQELKARLDAGGAMNRVLVMPAPVNESGSIPGSIHCDSARHGMRPLAKDEPFMVYGSAPSCADRRLGCTQLEAEGCTTVMPFRGGISTWLEAGYRLESRSDTPVADHIRMSPAPEGIPALLG